jgi:exosome complex component CSL4
MDNSGKPLVVPGEFLGTEEEYLAGSGTFSENERIYAAIVGKPKEEARQISVLQLRSLRPLAVGTTVIGFVENIVEPLALVNIQTGAHPDPDFRYGENPDYAVLHASMIRSGFVRNVRDEYKIGDIIRAKIAAIQNGELRLTTDGSELGAIKAFCAKCRHPLKLESGILKCENCGEKDNRKIASDYRRAIIKRR